MGHQGNSQPHVCLPASTSDLQGNWRGHTELMESPLGCFAALLSLASAASGTTTLLLGSFRWPRGCCVPVPPFLSLLPLLSCPPLGCGLLLLGPGMPHILLLCLG